jgi:DNA-directed RNA polymerase specialized sigma24 family protein
MTPHCRELWRLILQGHGYSEISHRLGVRQGTLRVRLLRCRRAATARWRELTGSNP